MSKNPEIKYEETGKTRESSVSVTIPGTKNNLVFARGPIRRHLTEGKDGWPIYDWLMLQDGRWYDFHRVAKMDEASVVDLEQVSIGNEIIIPPGLIYRLGLADVAALAKWRAAQDRIEAKLMAPRVDDHGHHGMKVITQNGG